MSADIWSVRRIDVCALWKEQEADLRPHASTKESQSEHDHMTCSFLCPEELACHLFSDDLWPVSLCNSSSPRGMDLDARCP